MTSDKATLRKACIAARNATLPEVRAAADAAICHHILGSDLYQNASAVLLYAAIRSEVNLNAVITAALTDGKQVALPRICSEGVMHFYLITSLQDLAEGTMQIAEPDKHCPLYTPPEDSLMLVPGIAFDKEGYRIGWGGGYYDRYLPVFCGVTAGITREAQFTSKIPHEPHDRAVDHIITEKQIYKVTEYGT